MTRLFWSSRRCQVPFMIWRRGIKLNIKQVKSSAKPYYVCQLMRHKSISVVWRIQIKRRLPSDVGDETAFGSRAHLSHFLTPQEKPRNQCSCSVSTVVHLHPHGNTLLFWPMDRGNPPCFHCIESYISYFPHRQEIDIETCPLLYLDRVMWATSIASISGLIHKGSQRNSWKQKHSSLLLAGFYTVCVLAVVSNASLCQGAEGTLAGKGVAVVLRSTLIGARLTASVSKHTTFNHNQKYKDKSN